MKRAQIKERNRRALLDAARRLVARDGPGAKLEEIATDAGLTTGAVYSLFGSKSGLLVAVVGDYLDPQYQEAERAIPADLDLGAAVEAFARLYYRRICDSPDALGHLGLQISLGEAALREPELWPRVAAAIRVGEERLAALFVGRSLNGHSVTLRQARRLTAALRALLVGLSQGVTLGLADGVLEQFFADTARALATPTVLGPP